MEKADNRISYVNYDSKRGHVGKSYYTACEMGIVEFIKKEGWNYSLEDKTHYEKRNNGCHVESSYLCHKIWTTVMNNKFNSGLPYSSNHMYWSDKKNDTPVMFHFDIMNNPKKNSCGISRLCKDGSRIEKWESIYHHIGNMAPIPWIELIGGYIDGQSLHNALDERWDLFLRFLKSNWCSWNICNTISFEKYMILTCQHIYYKDIYEEIDDDNRIDIDTLARWEKIIQPDSELITFSEYHDINDIVDMIIRIIGLRDHIISLRIQRNYI